MTMWSLSSCILGKNWDLEPGSWESTKQLKERNQVTTLGYNKP